MKAMKLTVLAALIAALSLPVAVAAQQTGQQPAATQQQSTPSHQRTPVIYRRWSQFLAGINLSNDQHDKIQNLIDQYAQTHPAGSRRDPQAARQLRDGIYAILTPDQLTQVKQTVAQLRAKLQARMQQRRQQQQQQNPQQQYPQQQSAGQPQNPQQPQWMEQHPEPAQTPI